MISAGRGVRRILEGPADTGLDLAQGDRRMGGGGAVQAQGGRGRNAPQLPVLCARLYLQVPTELKMTE